MCLRVARLVAASLTRMTSCVALSALRHEASSRVASSKVAVTAAALRVSSSVSAAAELGSRGPSAPVTLGRAPSPGPGAWGWVGAEVGRTVLGTGGLAVVTVSPRSGDCLSSLEVGAGAGAGLWLEEKASSSTTLSAACWLSAGSSLLVSWQSTSRHATQNLDPFLHEKHSSAN